MKIKLVKAELSDAEKLLEIQKSCFTPHLERYQDYETSPATINPNKLHRQIQNENFFKILMDDSWIGSINIRKLDNEGNYMYSGLICQDNFLMNLSLGGKHTFL